MSYLTYIKIHHFKSIEDLELKEKNQLKLKKLKNKVIELEEKIDNILEILRTK